MVDVSVAVAINSFLQTFCAEKIVGCSETEGGKSNTLGPVFITFIRLPPQPERE